MRDKDQILLEQAYQSILETNRGPLGEEEANKLMIGFNMLPQERKAAAFERLKELEGKKVVLLRGSRHKTSTSYGRDDGTATVPGAGGSVADTEFEIIYQPQTQGIISAVEQLKNQKQYTLNGNLILTINGKDYNVNQGHSAKLKFL